jgi:U3-containing 90S pre-ribosomal complex subunit
MGGDDLDNDDYDYLVQEIKDSAVDELNRMRRAGDTTGDHAVEDDDDEYDDASEPQQRTTKRKQQQHDDGDNDVQPEGRQEQDTSSKKKKSKSSCSSSSSSPEMLLLEASRSLETTEQQAAFLSASLRHYTLTTTNQDPEISLDAAAHFVASNKATLVERLKDCISSNKLKNKNKGKSKSSSSNSSNSVASPTVVIVCQSARRAVAILKECAALNMRVAKLFPKNGSVESQLAQLRASSTTGAPFGLAVGTPHRLQQLCQAGSQGGLSFSKTQLVVLDCHASPKGFTVCTLPDTAPHTMSLLRDFVVPELLKERGRKDSIRLAFF